MNWNNTQLDNSMPVTVWVARQVGAILKYVDRASTAPTSYAYGGAMTKRTHFLNPCIE